MTGVFLPIVSPFCPGKIHPSSLAFIIELGDSSLFFEFLFICYQIDHIISLRRPNVNVVTVHCPVWYLSVEYMGF